MGNKLTRIAALLAVAAFLGGISVGAANRSGNVGHDVALISTANSDEGPNSPLP
jgi:hypothetical protein